MKMKSKYFFIIWTLVVVSTFLVVVVAITLWSLNVKVVDNPQFSLPEGAVARLGKGNIVGRIQYSPDGAFIAIPSSIGVWLHDADTLKEIYLFTAQKEDILKSVCFSPDGQTLAITEKNITYLWDITTGTRKATLHTPQSNTVDTVIFSPDGKTVARGIRNGQVQIWDAQSGRLKTTFLRPSDTPHPDSMNIIAFSPDGQTLASISESHTTLYLWDVATGTHITHHISSSRNSTGDSLTFSPDGGTLAKLNNDITISLWDVATGTHKKDINITNNRYYINDIQFRPDGKTLAASGQFDYYLWDINTGGKINTTDVEKNIACISPDEKTWVLQKTIDNITYIQLWDEVKAKPKKTVQWLSGGHPVLFSPDAKTMVSGDKGYIQSGNLNLWHFDFNNVENITHRATLKSDILGHYSLRFGRNEKRLMQIGAESGNLWKIGSLTLKDQFSRAKPNFAYGEINPMSIISDKRAVIRTQQGFGMWDFVAGKYKLIPVNDPRWDNPESICFSPDGKMCASGKLDGVELWDVAAGMHKMSLTGHGLWDVVSVCFSPDGKVLASGGGSGRALRDPRIRRSEPPTIRLWDVATGKHIATLKGHSDNVAALVFSHDGQYLASGDWQKIHVWDVATSELKDTFHGHKDYVTSLVFSPYDQYLASGESGTTLLWDIRHISGFIMFFCETDWDFPN